MFIDRPQFEAVCLAFAKPRNAPALKFRNIPIYPFDVFNPKGERV